MRRNGSDLPCRIVSISEDSDSLGEDGDPDLYEVLEEVEALFKRVDVRPDSNENFFEACLDPDGHVLGASVVGLYSNEPDDADPLQRPRYSFSVAVDEPHRRKGLARALVKSVLASFPKEDVLLEGKVVNPHMVTLLKELGFFYYDEDRDEEFSDFDRRVGRRMYRPNPSLASERDPDGAKRRGRLIRLADKRILAMREEGFAPLATAEDAAQAALLAELEVMARESGKVSARAAAYQAMYEELASSASVAEVSLTSLRRALTTMARTEDAEEQRGARSLLSTFSRREMPRHLAEPRTEDRLEFSDWLRRAIKDLTYREREIIKLLYGLGDGHSYSLEEIGRMFKVTGARISQIGKKAIQKLRASIERYGDPL